MGESGCGKSTTGSMLLHLVPPTDGSVRFQVTEVTSLDAQGLRRLRRKMQIVFQDPYASLNPAMTVQAIIADPLMVLEL